MISEPGYYYVTVFNLTTSHDVASSTGMDYTDFTI